MKKFVVVAFTLCVTFMVSDVFANNVGCGFGTELLKGKKGKVFEILAVTTNATSASSTFAITSGTSGYKEGQAIGANVAESYVAENMESLANDIAKGDGEYLNTLATIMKVQNRDAFKSKLNQNFKKIYTSKDVTSKEVVANIQNIQNS